jgi:hypothetical protein
MAHWTTQQRQAIASHSHSLQHSAQHSAQHWEEPQKQR